MALQDNKDLSRRFLEELWNRKNVSIIDELLADNYVDHTPPRSSSDAGPQGSKALRQLFAEVQNSFSNIHVSIEVQMAEENKVMTQVTWKCTPKSDDSSTASQVTVMGVGIDRIEGGKIVENWNTLDILYRLLNLLEESDPLPPSTLGPPPPGPPLSRVPRRCDRDNRCPPGYMCQSNRCNRV